MTAEDGIAAGGFGEQVMRIAAEEGLNADRIRIFGIPYECVGHGSISELYHMFGMDGRAMADHCISALGDISRSRDVSEADK